MKNWFSYTYLIIHFLSKDELENRQPMADCRKELLMEIGVSVSMSV